MKQLISALWLVSNLAIGTAWAQPYAPNDMGVTMGHWHLNSADVEANKKIFVGMGGTHIKAGVFDIVRFPGVVVMLNLRDAKSPPSAGTDGSVVNHAEAAGMILHQPRSVFVALARDAAAILAGERAAGRGHRRDRGRHARFVHFVERLGNAPGDHRRLQFALELRHIFRGRNVVMDVDAVRRCVHGARSATVRSMSRRAARSPTTRSPTTSSRKRDRRSRIRRAST